MKKCPYCGAEYPDDAIICAIDQTPFEEPQLEPYNKESFQRVLRSPLGVATATGLATFLIYTGTYFAVGRTSLIIYKILHPDYVGPVGAQEIILLSAPLRWLLMTGFVIFTFSMGWMYCQKRWHAMFVTAISIMVWFLFFRGTFLMFVLPAFLIGLTTNLSAGYYLGSALQIFIGVWLLRCLKRIKVQSKINIV